MLHIAHRGCADQFPENTLAAFRSVVDDVDRIELDVVQCGSGELVAFHDAETDDLTDGSYAVAETDYETLADLSVLGTDEHIPLLADALDAIPASVDVQLDLKRPGIARAAREVTDRYDHDLYLCATDPDILAEAGRHSWDVRPGYVSFGHFQYEDVDPDSVTESEWREAVATATDHDCTFLEVPHELCVRTDVVEAAHEADLSVVAWTIRTADRLADLDERGVDAAMVDRIDIL
ncbi:glycerophosphodiester phosphodiesterase [Halorussus halobius]|uniref:glycerophosphodiester phosphodiesterase n=1 Tax=Halorussus halobius TaxID=1710537 RepID=UPI00143DF08E|nr:glycerophosphodiester phosphodiesterase [Halorussus halobius]